MTEPDPREEKLPRWAQSQLRVLRQNYEYLERKIEGLVQPVEESAIVVSVGHDRDFPVPKDARVSFRMEDDSDRVANHIQVVLHQDKEGRYLQVHGGRTVKITPAASNHFEVRLD